MNNNEILEKLSNIHTQSFSLEEFDQQLQNMKVKAVKENDQATAKQIWIYQTIIEIHKTYREAFVQLKNKQYYEGWRKLERIEIILSSLKRHFQYNKEEYFLWYIEKAVKNLQVVFPYRMFASAEILKKKTKCSVCDKEVSIRNPCGHIVHEIYNGEMCHRIVTESEILGISLVENPGNKYAVMFLKDEKTGEQKDHYNYDAIDHLFECLELPYEKWELEVSLREFKKEDYGDANRNDICPCGSGKKFKRCCIENIGKKYPHYGFTVTNPSNKIFITNTVKKRN